MDLVKQNSLTSIDKNEIETEKVDTKIISKNAVSNIEPEMEKSESETEVHNSKSELNKQNSIIDVDDKNIIIEELPAKSSPEKVETLKSETDITASKVPVPATRKKSQKNTNSSLFLIGSFNESNTDYSLIMKQK